VPLRARWRSPGSYRSAASRDRRCGASEQHQQTEYPDSARPHPNSLTSTFSPTPAWWRPDARSIPASAIYLQGIDSSEIISTVHGRPSLTISANSRTPVEALGARTIGRTDICRPTRWAHPRLAIRRSKVAFVDRPALAPSARRCSRGVYSDSLERGATGLTAAGSEFSQKMQQSRAADETPSGRPYGEPAAISKSTLPRFRYVAKVKSTPGAELEPQLSISSPSVVAIEAPATATIQHSRRRPQTSLRAAERNSD
jgi:hypothetical protein